MTERLPTLRDRAESLLKSTSPVNAGKSAEEMQHLLHELRVHQMELEIQNEEVRRAQVELAHSRDRYADLYEFAPVGYLTLDKHGVILESNVTASVMLNVDRRRLIGHKFSEFVSPNAQDDWHLHRREVFSDSKTVVLGELEMVVVDRGPLTFRLQSLTIPDVEGQLSQCRTTIADVTERQIAYHALRMLNIDLNHSLGNKSTELDQSIEKIRLLSEAVSHLGEGVMITGDDLDWPGPTIVFVNPAMCQMSGYTAEELLGQSPRILQGEGSDRKSLDKIRDNLKSGGSCVAEVVNYRKDGTAYDVELFITPLFDATGRRTNFVSIQRDITARKTIAEALRVEHELSHAIIQTSQSVILVLDEQGHIELFNPSLETITGYSAEEVHNRDWFEMFIPEQNREKSRAQFRHAFAGGATRRMVSPITTKVGQERFIEWNYSLLTGEDGRLIGLLCSGQDITERRELEQHILSVTSDEQRRIGSDLHDGVGQELTGMTMIADTLILTLPQDSKIQREIAESIRKGLRRALSQVRALSRGLNPVDVDSAGLMSALSELCTSMNELYGVGCNFQCAQRVLLADNQTATQLYRIAQEAMTNAIRHAKPTQTTISLSCEDGTVLLRVTDNGKGIEAAESSTGMGLRTMQYRARSINADLAINRLDSGGTEVVCKLLV